MTFQEKNLSTYPLLLFGDCNKKLDEILDGSIKLVVTSPPYNIGKEYETETKMSLDEYLEWLEPIVKKIYSKITDDGSICWQVGSYVLNGEVFPLDFFFYDMFIKQGFKLRNRVIWRYNFGLHATNRLSGRYETLLWFTKTNDYTFNLDAIRVPQLYPGKRHSKYKGELAGTPSGNPLGKNPSDYWEFSGETAFKDDPIWDLPNVKSNHPEKTMHPCQFPIELAERCVLAFSNETDTVLDPFMGTGTSMIASLKHKRKSIGIDKNTDYLKLAKERINSFHRGELRMRKSGQKIQQPKVGQKVATIPEDWKVHPE